MPARERPLAGVGVLVTRPAAQADGLARLIEDAGGEAIRFPTIEIVPPADLTALLALLDRLAAFDLAVFVSRNAVEQTLSLLAQRRQSLPTGLQIACVGAASAAALRQFGVGDVLVPADRFDSEGLLALPALRQVHGRRVVIFRGDRGRELLADTLRARGAVVEYASCYRTQRPPTDSTALIARWARGEVHIVSLTSSDGARNLYDMLGANGRQWLLATPAVVLSARQAATCGELGFRQPALVAATAADSAIVRTLCDWANTRPR